MADFPQPPIFSYLMSGEMHGLHAYGFPPLAPVPDAVTQLLYSTVYIDQFNNAKYNPIECVISCHQIPVLVKTTSTVQYFMASGKRWDLPVAIEEISNRYTTFNCGSISIPRTENNASDFDKKITLHIPFCSSLEIPAVFCVGGSIEIQYTIDVLTGDCIAHVKTADSNNNTALMSSTGNCAVTIPISSQIDKTQQNLAHSVSNSVASVTTSVIASAMSGNPLSAVGSVTNAIDSYYAAKETPVITTSTTISGNVAVMDYRTPYATVVTPRTENNRSYLGGSSHGIHKIGSCSGFMKFKNVDLGALKSRANENIWATAEELAILEDMLKQGVFA